MRELVQIGCLAAALVLVAFLSTAWTIAPRLTFERSASFAVLMVGTIAFAYAAQFSEQFAAALLKGIIVGSGVAASLGLVVLVFAFNDAVQSGTDALPWRYRGFGQNPNTISMLAALGLPACGWLVVVSRRRTRVAAIATALLLFGSIAASGSRGALLGCAVGVAVFIGGLDPAWRSRAIAIGTALVLIVGGVAISRLAKPNLGAGPSSAPPTFIVPPPHKHGKPGTTAHHATTFVPYSPGRLEDELGRPAPGQAAEPQRTLLGSSGRAQAWVGAFHLANARPLLGFGFGTEERTFVDRYYSFQGSRPEESWLGIYLQLGAVGVGLLALIWFVVGRQAIRALGRDRGADPAGAALAGITAAALALSLVQSYIYSVGNVATVTAWIAGMLLVIRRGASTAGSQPANRSNWAREGSSV